MKGRKDLDALEERVAALESFVDHCHSAWYAGVDALEELKGNLRRHVDQALDEARQDFIERIDQLARDERAEREENL